MNSGSPPTGGLLRCREQEAAAGVLLHRMERYTYLLLDVLSIAFPLLASFEKRLRFWRKWPGLFIGIGVMAAIFIPWDIAFTARGIWGFNERFLTGIHLAGLPMEEWLFFLMIPYACMFLYEVMRHFIKRDVLGSAAPRIAIAIAVVLLVVASFNLDRSYTSITFISTAILLIYHTIRRTVWLGRFFIGYAISLIPFLLVNGMLTGTWLQAPIVWYNDQENLGIRIGTIPIEDSIYLLLLLLIVTTFYEAKIDRSSELTTYN